MAITLAILLLLLQLASSTLVPAPAPAPVPVNPPGHTPVVPTHPPLNPHVPAHSPLHPPVPTHPPLNPPVPTHPPLHPPISAHPPLHPSPIPRTFIAVHGVVYVKSCKYAGVNTLWGATPLLGAIVKLECNNTKHELVLSDKTDKNGHFYIEGTKNITSYGAHKCNVVLVSAPNGLKPSNLNGGLTGAALKPKKLFVSKGLPFFLYNVGPLAFEPKCPR